MNKTFFTGNLTHFIANNLPQFFLILSLMCNKLIRFEIRPNMLIRTIEQCSQKKPQVSEVAYLKMEGISANTEIAGIALEKLLEQEIRLINCAFLTNKQDPQTSDSITDIRLLLSTEEDIPALYRTGALSEKGFIHWALTNMGYHQTISAVDNKNRLILSDPYAIDICDELVGKGLPA